ncbi:enoyl-CoA hydratase/isomerase family protein [Neoroseomonas soli]|uniref:Enoyl-CoA hydratase/isomerase family protein n=1 Tax=Neoroseomonas soli TaxID=1081025 RepID=A0A9X9WRF7_9PROT|nr:enoyl-CoA hydratase-related protein [Neoroseomonas soli]MBR0669736.1 enoyl-CoA hydratase/isomerase family protein [Neoroseomonas soli]
MPHDLIRTSREGVIATVLIDREGKRNCLDLPMWVALGEAFAALSADESLRAVVVRGAGEAAFCAGADIAAFAAERGTPEREEVYARELHGAFHAIRTCIHPTIAACSGWTMGGGCGIATMCDFRVGSPATRMGIPARNLGIFYAYEEIDPIMQMVGYAVTAEILIEGRVFTGEEAQAKGLLSRLVEDGAVHAEAQALAERIAQGSPLSARFHKRAMQQLRGELPITAEDRVREGSFAYTEDFRNAARAFLDKRKPVFEGR